MKAITKAIYLVTTLEKVLYYNILYFINILSYILRYIFRHAFIRVDLLTLL